MKDQKIITVYKDGSWKVWDKPLDATYACDDPDWLVNIPREISEAEVVQKFKAMCEESINPDLCSTLVDKIIPALILSRKALKESNNGK